MAAQSNLSVQALDNPFSFSSHNIRTAIGDDGEAWFCAKDVFEALDILWSGTGTSLRNYPQEWICPLYLRGQSGSGDVIFISEPAVYRVLFRSNKPEAIEFANWVCAEVLPAIRRQGYYGEITANQQIALRSQMIKLMKELKTNDAFVRKMVITSLRNVCNQLGEPMPDINLIGKDYKQLELGV